MIKTEKNYRKLGGLAQKLGVPIFEAFLTLEVFDKNGKLIKRHHQRSHSWVRNAYNHMFSQLAGVDIDDSTFGAGLLSAKDTGGIVRYGSYELFIQSYMFSVESVGYGYRAGATVDDFGIVVGSGTNAESFEDYVLQTPIADGTSAGQLSYVESAAPAIVWTAGTLTLKNDLIRYFNNNTGGNVSVNEVSLIQYCRIEDNVYYILHVRDHLASTVTVPDTGQLKVTYTISLVYPS